MAKEATGRKQSPIDENMYEVEGTTSIGNNPPPGEQTFAEVHFEELGKLSSFPATTEIDNPEEGTGDWCVVLSDFFSGAGEHDNFIKGHVRRLSRLVPGYATEKNREIIKARVRRLLEMKAMRLATSDEVGNDRVVVTLESESESMQAERTRRMAAEQEVAILRERLGLAHDAQIAATPERAGASDEAQKATGQESAGGPEADFDA